MKRLVRFLTHPIWCYSIPGIARAVWRDWHNVETIGRGLLRHMLQRESTAVDIVFTTEDGRQLIIECRIKPNPSGHGETTRSG